MTDEFQKGLITGLAMQPLQVTTEHADPDTITASDFIRCFISVGGLVNIVRAVGENAE